MIDKLDEYFARTNEIHEKLQELYPQIFSIDNPKLLKIGINKDIKAEAKIKASSQELGRFFRYFCTRPTYTKQQIIGAKRYNLQGKEEGEVTEKDLKAKSIAWANFKAKNKDLKMKKGNNIQKPEITIE